MCCGLQVIDAKTPQAVLGVEGEDPRVDARCVCVPVFQLAVFLRQCVYSSSASMLKDERAKQDPTRSLFAQEFTDRLG